MVEVMVASGMLAIVAVGFMTMMKSSTRATRDIASRSNVTDLSNGIDALFGSVGCATTGASLAGGAAGSVVPGAGSYTLTLDTLRFAAGGIAVTTLPNADITAMIQPNAIDSMTFEALGGEGPIGTGFIYPFRLRVRFRNPQGFPAQPITKFVMIYTNPANVVVGGCFEGVGSRVARASNRVNHNDVINPPGGFTRAECSLIVSPEDTHVDADYGGGFGDTNLWADNHYAGSQAFFDANWRVTCQYGFKEFDTLVPPTWRPGKCSYLVVCTK